MIVYQVEDGLEVEEFIGVLNRTTLGEGRPVNDPDRIARMLQHANLIVTARDEGELVGVARCLTDWAYCTYLSDLAVVEAYQRQGIGKELIRTTKRQAPQAKIILLSAPLAVDYYPKIGMTHHNHCFVLDRVEDLT